MDQSNKDNRNIAEISVIVPVYKVEKYIHRCVDSILNQTFRDFELILVDDGSPDNCGAVCDEYAAKDSRVKVIHQENGGLSAARNAGLDIAQGKYIMFCDSDDYVAPEWCEQMRLQMRDDVEAFVVCNIWRVFNDSEKTRCTEETENAEVDYFAIYRRGLSAYVWNKIYRADILRRYNLRFDEACSFAEDVGFNVRYCMLCKRCIYIAAPLYYYVDTPNSIMNQYYPNYFELHLPLFQCRIPLIDEKDLGEYCDIWLYYFLQLFGNVFDSRCNLSLLEKLRFNQRMIRSEEFRCCLNHCTGNKESPLTLKILGTHNYYLFWIFGKLVHLKQKIFKH